VGQYFTGVSGEVTGAIAEDWSYPVTPDISQGLEEMIVQFPDEALNGEILTAGPAVEKHPASGPFEIQPTLAHWAVGSSILQTLLSSGFHPLGIVGGGLSSHRGGRQRKSCLS